MNNWATGTLVGACVGIGVIVLMAAFGLFLAIFVYLLWNWLMPLLFGLPEVTYWQAWGLLVLCGMLFKSDTTTNTTKG